MQLGGTVNRLKPFCGAGMTQAAEGAASSARGTRGRVTVVGAIATIEEEEQSCSEVVTRMLWSDLLIGDSIVLHQPGGRRCAPAAAAAASKTPCATVVKFRRSYRKIFATAPAYGGQQHKWAGSGSSWGGAVLKIRR